jgi:hypothetical protein
MKMGVTRTCGRDLRLALRGGQPASLGKMDGHEEFAVAILLDVHGIFSRSEKMADLSNQ